MKLVRIKTCLTLASLFVAGFSLPAYSGENVPLKGSLEAVVTVTPIIGDPVFDVHVELDGVGHGTQLGEFTLFAPHDVDRKLPPDPSVAVGEYILTAANGDELHATFTGLSLPFAPGILQILETATITGGTGRFVTATGSFQCERLFDIASGTTMGTYTGFISSVGSAK